MYKFTYTIKDPIGLHARPAGLLAKTAKAFGSTVTVQKGERSVLATQLMNLMTMGIKQGDTVTVTIEGDDEIPCRAAIEQFFKQYL